MTGLDEGLLQREQPSTHHNRDIITPGLVPSGDFMIVWHPAIQGSWLFLRIISWRRCWWILAEIWMGWIGVSVRSLQLLDNCLSKPLSHAGRILTLMKIMDRREKCNLIPSLQTPLMSPSRGSGWLSPHVVVGPLTRPYCPDPRTLSRTYKPWKSPKWGLVARTVCNYNPQTRTITTSG
jgi:hypothetical protein